MQISIFEFCVDLQFHCLIFEFRFDFLLINQTHAWLCTFTLTSVSGKLFYVAPSCYLKCPCHPMSVPQSCIFEIFFEILYLIETLAQFSQPLQSCFSFSPPVRWGLLDFMSVSSPPPPVLLLLLLLPRPPPVAILWVQCGVPDPNRELVSSVWRAGPQPRSCEFSVAARTPTAILWVQCGGPDPNRDPVSSVWRPGPQPRSCEFSVACRTSSIVSENLSERYVRRYVRKNVKRYVWKMSERMSEDMSERMSKDMSERCQKECQKICQKECQKICQKECQKISQEECQKISQKECQKICQ